MEDFNPDPGAIAFDLAIADRLDARAMLRGLWHGLGDLIEERVVTGETLFANFSKFHFRGVLSASEFPLNASR